jgi:hypothetical protein
VKIGERKTRELKTETKLDEKDRVCGRRMVLSECQNKVVFTQNISGAD